jgi:MFS family permease
MNDKIKNVILHPNFRLIWTGILVGLVNSFAWFGTFTFVNGYIVKELGFSNQQWTTVSLCFSGGIVFWSIFALEIATWIGRRNTLTIGFVLTGIIYFLLGGLRNLYVIGLLLWLMGYIPAVYNGCWLAIAASVNNSKSSRMLVINQLVLILTGILALICSGYIITLIGFQKTFLLFGGICLICGALFHVSVVPLAERANCQIKSFRQFSRHDISGLFSLPLCIILLFGFCLEPFNYHTINQLLPNLTRDYYHFSENAVGMLVALGRLPAILVLIILIYSVTVLNVLRVYGFCMMIAGVMVFLQGWIHSTHSMILLFFLFYLFHGGSWGTNTATVNQIIPQQMRDSVFSLLSIVGTLMIFLVGFFHNRLLASGFSLQDVFYYCGFFSMGGGMILFIYSFMVKPAAFEKNSLP